MTAIIGAGVDMANPPDPPSDYHIHEDFETGGVSSAWTESWGSENVTTYTVAGIPAPPSGDTYVRGIASSNGLALAITGVADIWATIREYFQARTVWEPLMEGLYDGAEVFKVSFTTAGKFAIHCPSYSGDWQIGTTVFADNSWVACKARVVLHDTAGVLQLWSWLSGAWNLEIDLQNINTWHEIRPFINKVLAPRQATSAHYCDEVNFLKSDPGLEMR